jgi:cellobiose-specific phosphotransferase system component IIA
MPDAPKRPGNMNKILSLVDRTSGEARSFVVKDLRLAKAGEALKHPGGIKEARLALLDAARLYEGVRNDQSRDDDKFLNNVNGL